MSAMWFKINTQKDLYYTVFFPPHLKITRLWRIDDNIVEELGVHILWACADHCTLKRKINWLEVRNDHYRDLISTTDLQSITSCSRIVFASFITSH